MLIRKFKKSDLNHIKNISKLLYPKWFDNNALKHIPIDSQVNNCFVAEVANKILGFITFSSQDGEARINWFGISPNEHRKGIGSKLLEKVETFVKKIGINKIIVETVVEQNPSDGSYDKTIKFYYNNGFRIRKKYPQERFKEFTYSKGIIEKVI